MQIMLSTLLWCDPGRSWTLVRRSQKPAFFFMVTVKDRGQTLLPAQRQKTRLLEGFVCPREHESFPGTRIRNKMSPPKSRRIRLTTTALGRPRNPAGGIETLIEE